MAFVVGDYFTNLLLVKSTDGGDTWQETMIWEHPFPYMQFGVTVTDTFWANSGSMDIALDENLRANVVFALCRIKSDESGWYYDPMADGIVYWNEDMDSFSNNVNALSPIGHPDSELIEDYNLIGWTQDINENGVIDFVSSASNPPFYPSLGLSTTPSITADDNERITVVWSSLTETYDNGVNNYRHLWARLSPNNGEWWGSFVDLTSDLIHIFDECVFPNSASLVDDHLHLIYQVDQSPGWSGNNYPPNENHMTYMKVSLYGYPPPYILANFTSDFTTIHEGDTVHFINLSEINPPGIISSYWTFEGGDPGSSYTTNPYVIYYNEGSYDVSLIVEGSQMTDFEIKEDYITVLPQTGFRDFNSHDFISIAPNPAFDDVFVQVNKREIGAIQIIDYLGKVVFKSTSILTNEVKLDLSYLQRGVYFIIISGEDFNHTEKLILK
jgi:hypothetical protein